MHRRAPHPADLFPTGRASAGQGGSLHPPGTLLRRRYEVLRPLGVGGMGAVYLVQDSLRHRQLALKCLHPLEGGDDPRRLARELAIQEGLSHRGLVRTFELDLDPDAGQLFFTMEYVDGVSLAQVLDQARSESRHPPLAFADVCAIFEGLVEVLAYTHGEGVLHRDLKPSNVMLLSGPQGVEGIKLLDFGIARSLHPQEAHTTSLVMAGTPAYMAPEQWSGPSDALTPAADIFALAMMLYQMLTGAGVMMGRLPGPGEWLREQGIDAPFPAALDAVVLKALDTFPRRRYPDVEAFRQAWDAALRGEQPSATASSPLALVEPTTTSLRLHGQPIPGQELHLLAELKQLRSLILNDVGLHDSGLVHLSGLTALEVLHLTHNPIHGAGLCHLQPLKHLRALALGCTPLKPEALEILGELRGLSWLSLWHTATDDRALSALCKLKGLRHLQLSQTSITSRAVPFLCQMGQLRSLELWQTALSDADLHSLHEALPQCHIRPGG